jgi:nicotinate phosphoribosyltransferase
MNPKPAWITADNVALLTDLYELTMLQAYWREGMDREATFSLYSRSLSSTRNFLLACGLSDALDFLETMRFTPRALDYLASRDEFSGEFLDWLKDFRFSGTVRAVPEGTPVFPDEPLLEVTGPLPEAQVVETVLMNQVHFQTVAASKAARVVLAADGRAVVDFGLRRIHGTDAGLKGARAFYVAGAAATSNVLAGEVYGVPITGTMAHAYIQAHDDEMTAFREFTELYPDTILLVDTYDTLEGVRKVISLAREKGEAFRVRGIRLDSGDLADLARKSRDLLDEAGLTDVQIFASGGLDEDKIAEMVRAGAPIDGFGVGTRMSVSRDTPALDMAYKLTAYGGKGRLKLSTGKPLLPGPKQVFRQEEGGMATGDLVALEEEDHQGRPLLVPVMEGGERLPEGSRNLEEVRTYAKEQIRSLPPRLRAMEKADPPYPVNVSDTLKEYHEEVAERVE